MQLTRYRPFAATSALACFALVACVPPAPEPTPAPSPAPSPRASAQPEAAPPQVATPVYDNWMDAPATSGDWFYRTGSGETLAIFGTSPAPADTRLLVICRLPTRRVALAYVGAVSGQAEMRIRTETTDRTLTAAPAGGEQRLALVELAASDPLLDAIAFSKGRFAVNVAGQPPVFAPAWPEITRVIEDCRG